MIRSHSSGHARSVAAVAAFGVLAAMTGCTVEAVADGAASSASSASSASVTVRAQSTVPTSDTARPTTSSAASVSTSPTIAADTSTPTTSSSATSGAATTSLAQPTDPELTSPTSAPTAPGNGTSLVVGAVAAAAQSLAADNSAVSVTVLRDRTHAYSFASGSGPDGQPITTDTPMVLASVSKLITALTVARLIEAGAVALTDPVPWSAMGVARDPAWDDVAVGELLTHTSGMPVARKSWFDDPGSCAVPLSDVMASPPTPERGTWVYSNGNYCALGLMIEAITGVGLAAAADELVFTPLSISGPHLSTDPRPRLDGPYAPGVARLERLGGAGAWLASSDDIATMLAAVVATDRPALSWPGVMVDQYGWGHTGTVDGAKACAWALEGGRTIVVTIVAGNRPSTGGKVCDLMVPAVAADLGIWADEPVRSPV